MPLHPVNNAVPVAHLDPRDDELDLEILPALAQARMVKPEGGEALSTVVLRLLSCAEKIH